MPGLGPRPGRLRELLAIASAPASPPRSAPLPGPALVTKKLIAACCACAGAAQSIAKHAASGTPIRRAVIEVPPDIGAARRPATAGQNPGNVSLFRPFTRP